MALHFVTAALCRQSGAVAAATVAYRTSPVVNVVVSHLQQNHFASQSSLIQLCIRNFSSKKMGLPRVFFDMTADNQPVGRVIMEVSKFNAVYLFRVHAIVHFSGCVKKCDFSGVHLFRWLESPAAAAIHN